MQYSETVTEHFERPRNVASPGLAGSQAGKAGDARRGSIIEFHVRVADNRIEALQFRAWGCPHTIAVASWLTGELTGRALADLLPLDLESVADQLGLPTDKWHCVLTAEDALRAALEE